LERTTRSVKYLEQWAAELQHQQQRSGKRGLGNIADILELALQSDDLGHALRGSIHAVFLENRPRSQPSGE
jgi:hypothetical protein